jgi:hypothetical protein
MWVTFLKHPDFSDLSQWVNYPSIVGMYVVVTQSVFLQQFPVNVSFCDTSHTEENTQNKTITTTTKTMSVNW